MFEEELVSEEIRKYISQPLKDGIVHLQVEVPSKAGVEIRLVSVVQDLILSHADPPRDWATRVYKNWNVLMRVIVHMQFGVELGLGLSAIGAEEVRAFCREWKYEDGLTNWLNSTIAMDTD